MIYQSWYSKLFVLSLYSWINMALFEKWRGVSLTEVTVGLAHLLYPHWRGVISKFKASPRNEGVTWWEHVILCTSWGHLPPPRRSRQISLNPASSWRNISAVRVRSEVRIREIGHRLASSVRPSVSSPVKFSVTQATSVTLQVLLSLVYLMLCINYRKMLKLYFQH